jgi:VIT1/CCC1 family predicted Fe2+/Mn2+ transporter
LSRFFNYLQNNYMHNHPSHEKHSQSSDVLRDIVIGMSDGLTVPFALAAGLSGAINNTSLIIIAGLAEVAAGSIAMGLGGYLAGQTEVDHYNAELKREYEEVEQLPEKEKEEVREFFEGIGLSKEVQEKAVQELTKDKDVWVEFMMKHELGLERPEEKRARKSAFNIAFSYIVGGLVPLSPYFFTDSTFQGLKISAVITLICLFIFGYYKSSMTGVPPLKGGLKVMFIGAVAASAAFIIARLIQGH